MAFVCLGTHHVWQDRAAACVALHSARGVVFRVVAATGGRNWFLRPRGAIDPQLGPSSFRLKPVTGVPEHSGSSFVWAESKSRRDVATTPSHLGIPARPAMFVCAPQLCPDCPPAKPASAAAVCRNSVQPAIATASANTTVTQVVRGLPWFRRPGATFAYSRQQSLVRSAARGGGKPCGPCPSACVGTCAPPCSQAGARRATWVPWASSRCRSSVDEHSVYLWSSLPRERRNQRGIASQRCANVQWEVVYDSLQGSSVPWVGARDAYVPEEFVAPASRFLHKTMPHECCRARACGCRTQDVYPRTSNKRPCSSVNAQGLWPCALDRM